MPANLRPQAYNIGHYQLNDVFIEIELAMKNRNLKMCRGLMEQGLILHIEAEKILNEKLKED